MVQVSNPGYAVLRVKFNKTGSLQYISHLDLVRTMNKIIVRANLPLWYTEGFNPKPKMVFAAPLSIGTESRAEYMDIRLTHRIPTEEAKAALNRNLTDEMQVSEVYYPETKLTDMKWLEYEMTVKTGGASDELAAKCESFLLGDEVSVQKKNKNQKDEPVFMNIRPGIKEVACSYDGEYIKIKCILSADASSFLNPEYVIKALRKNLGVLSDPCLVNEYYSIMRVRAYCMDMTEFN
jgi:radical SAM-linked protein